MRGKLVKPTDGWMRLISYFEFFAGGYNASQFFKTHQWWYMIAAGFFFGMGVAMTVMHWLRNHPKIPKWAEDALREEDIALAPFREIHTLEEKPDKEDRHGSRNS